MRRHHWIKLARALVAALMREYSELYPDKRTLSLDELIGWWKEIRLGESQPYLNVMKLLEEAKLQDALSLLDFDSHPIDKGEALSDAWSYCICWAKKSHKIPLESAYLIRLLRWQDGGQRCDIGFTDVELSRELNDREVSAFMRNTFASFDFNLTNEGLAKLREPPWLENLGGQAGLDAFKHCCQAGIESVPIELRPACERHLSFLLSILEPPGKQEAKKLLQERTDLPGGWSE